MIANQTVGGEELLERLKEKAPRTADGTTLFIVVVPQKGGERRRHARGARAAGRLLDRLRDGGPARARA